MPLPYTSQALATADSPDSPQRSSIAAARMATIVELSEVDQSVGSDIGDEEDLRSVARAAQHAVSNEQLCFDVWRMH
jgi:hypothetical protein